MRQWLAFVALSLALSGCGGGTSGSVPAPTAGGPPMSPAMPSTLGRVPASRDFARPTFPAALRNLKIAELTPATLGTFAARRSAAGSRSPQGRSTGFFAGEVYVGPDASGFAAYWLPYFGYYTYAGTTPGSIPFPGFLYKYNFAWLYDLGGTSASASDAYFYDFGAPDGQIGVFYTAPTYGSDANSLYLYSFLLGNFLSYEQNSHTPRWFFDYATNAWLTGNAPLTETVGGTAGLVRPDSHRTLYYLDAETGSNQMCTAGCLSVWPALVPIPNSTTTTALSIVNRSDGSSMQWTYDGHPVYTFAGDSGPDQTNGDGIPDFGGHWHVARPAGSATPTPDPTGTPCYYYC
jgi:predicted lipoprotein with Yx(FWY)xxD motif